MAPAPQGENLSAEPQLGSPSRRRAGGGDGGGCEALQEITLIGKWCEKDVNLEKPFSLFLIFSFGFMCAANSTGWFQNTSDFFPLIWLEVIERNARESARE